MDKKKLFRKQFLVYWLVATVLSLHFLAIFLLGLMVNPFLAVAIWLLTLTACIYYVDKFRNWLAENL